MPENRLSFEFLWSDSLGAKTASTLVKTPEVNILIDPGVAVMQPSFPASWVKKFFWKARAWLSIKKASRKADVVVVSHYHFDHFTPSDMGTYEDKLLLTKNPNEFINDSQRSRVRNFFSNISENFGGMGLEEILEDREERDYVDPMDEIPHARDMDFGDYNFRRQELIEKWRKTYRKRVDNWNSWNKIPEINFENIEVRFPEEKKFEFGRTKLRFTSPLFHGIELAKTGWVFSTVVERGNQKFIHSSDLHGPTVEDYADWIIDENPDVLYLDGPATYLFGYMLNRTNLNRSIDNASRIIENTDSRVILFDHHLARDKDFRERTEKVWKTAERCETKVLTVAEYKGEIPVVLK